MIRSAEPDQTAPWGAADKGQLCKQFRSDCQSGSLLWIFLFIILSGSGLEVQYTIEASIRVFIVMICLNDWCRKAGY